MQICDDGHLEIVHNNGGRCPVCDAQDERDRFIKEVEILKGQLADLESINKQNEVRIRAYKEALEEIVYMNADSTTKEIAEKAIKNGS